VIPGACKGRVPVFFILMAGCTGLVLEARTQCRAGDWPGWRGPTGLGFTAEKHLLLTWGGKKNENVLWKAPLPGSDGKARPDQNQSSPIAWRGRVIVTASFWPQGADQKDYPEHHVLCFRASDGKKLWDTEVAPGPWKLTDLRGGYTAPTPATDGERIYVLFGSAVLAALDLDGKILWREKINPHPFDVAIGSSPVLYHDTVIVLGAMADKKESRLMAFDKRTGRLKWETKRPTMGFGHSTPVIVEVKGKPQMIVCASGIGVAADGVVGFDPASGKPLWWCKAAGDAASPAYGAGIVYCDSGRGGPGVAVDMTGQGDAATTHIRWRVAQVPAGLGSPIIVGGYVYRVHEPGVLRIWKAVTGEQVAARRLNGVSTWSSPVADGAGRIYLANAGKTYVIKAGPKAEVLAVNDLGDDSRASAAVSDGRIFLKGGRFLYCVGKK